jgi:Protein of unknown function (DUF1488)
VDARSNAKRVSNRQSLAGFRWNERPFGIRGMGASMPLTRGQILGHDTERLAFRFTMLNDGETVQCQISDAAMDELAGMKGTENTARQAQFLSLRDTIERIASGLFDKAPTIRGHVIRIFTKHLRR